MSRPPAALSTRHTIRRVIQIAGSLIAGAIFVILLARQDWRQALASLRAMPVWTLPLVLVLLFSGLALNALRWHLLLRSQGVPISFWLTLKIVVSGQFASNFLPSTIGGDALRIVCILPLAEGTPGGRVLAAGSVVLDRALNVAAMLTYLPFAWWVFAPLGGVATAGGGGALLALPGGAELKSWLKKQILNPAQRAFQFWRRRPLILAAAFLVAWLSILVVFVGVWVLARNLGLPVSLVDVMAVSALVYLVTLLPISVNGYGVREVAVTALYVQLGATIEQAAMLALTTRVLTLVETLPGALWVSQVLATAALGVDGAPPAAGAAWTEERP